MFCNSLIVFVCVLSVQVFPVTIDAKENAPRGGLKSMKEEFDSLKEEMDILLTQNANMQLKMDELETQNENLKKEIIDEVKTHKEEIIKTSSELKQEAGELKQETSDLKLETNELKQETSDLKLETSELKQETSDLKLETSELKQETSDLKLETSELKQETSTLKQETSELKLETNELKQETSELKQETDELKQETSDLKLETSELKIQNEIFKQEVLAKFGELSLMENRTVVAVQAKAKAKTYSPGEIIKFPTFLTSVGLINTDEFISTGKFNCTFPGFYVVSFLMMSDKAGGWFSVLKNNQWLNVLYIGNFTSGFRGVTGVFVIELQAGDTVYATCGTTFQQRVYDLSMMTIFKLN